MHLVGSGRLLDNLLGLRPLSICQKPPDRFRHDEEQSRKSLNEGMNGVKIVRIYWTSKCILYPLTQKWQVGQNLKSPPVSDKVGLQAQHSLTDGEGDLNGDSDQGGEPRPHVLHHQHEADHEAADAAHPRQDAHQAVTVGAPPTSAKGSEKEMF